MLIEIRRGLVAVPSWARGFVAVVGASAIVGTYVHHKLNESIEEQLNERLPKEVEKAVELKVRERVEWYFAPQRAIDTANYNFEIGNWSNGMAFLNNAIIDLNKRHIAEEFPSLESAIHLYTLQLSQSPTPTLQDERYEFLKWAFRSAPLQYTFEDNKNIAWYFFRKGSLAEATQKFLNVANDAEIGKCDSCAVGGYIGLLYTYLALGDVNSAKTVRNKIKSYNPDWEFRYDKLDVENRRCAGLYGEFSKSAEELDSYVVETVKVTGLK